MAENTPPSREYFELERQIYCAVISNSHLINLIAQVSEENGLPLESACLETARSFMKELLEK